MKFEIKEAANKITVKDRNRGFYSRKYSSPSKKLDNYLNYENSIFEREKR